MPNFETDEVDDEQSSFQTPKPTIIKSQEVYHAYGVIVRIGPPNDEQDERLRRVRARTPYEAVHLAVGKKFGKLDVLVFGRNSSGIQKFIAHEEVDGYVFQY